MNTFSNLKWQYWTAVICRIVVGGLLLWSSFWKLRDPYAFVSHVFAFEFGTFWTNALAGAVIPWIEFIAGALLILGIGLDGAFAVVVMLLFAFVVGQFGALSRGLDIACGCFGPQSGISSSVTLGSAIRSLTVLGVAVLGLLLTWFSTRNPSEPKSEVQRQ